MTMYGPMEAHVVALINRASQLTHGEARELANAWAAAPKVTWTAARTAAWDAARDAARAAARAAARDAAYAAAALVARDLIGQAWTQDAYDALTGPWRRVIGPCHPDDLPLEMP